MIPWGHPCPIRIAIIRTVGKETLDFFIMIASKGLFKPNFHESVPETPADFLPCPCPSALETLANLQMWICAGVTVQPACHARRRRPGRGGRLGASPAKACQRGRLRIAPWRNVLPACAATRRTRFNSQCFWARGTSCVLRCACWWAGSKGFVGRRWLAQSEPAHRKAARVWSHHDFWLPHFQEMASASVAYCPSAVGAFEWP